MKLIRKAGKTSQTLNIFMADSSSTTGAGLTGLAFNTASLTAYYVRPAAAAAAITLVTQTTTGAWSSGGFVEISSANMPGWYRFDIPDACLAAGVDSVGVHFKGATNLAPLPLEIDLDAQVDLTHILGTAVSTPATAGILDVNVKNIDNDAASASGTVTFPNATLASTTNITAGTITTVTTVTNQLTTAAIATGVWQDATAGDFTVASSIGKALYIANIAPGASGGHFISGSNAGTTTLGALTVTGATTLAALACTTLTASGAVAFQSTFATTGTTTFNALTVTNATTLTGAVSLGSTLGVTGTTTLAALNTGAVGTGNVTITGTLSTSGTATFNALTVTNAFSINGVSDVAQTGDSFARIGTAGSGLTSLAPSATALSTATWTGALATNIGTTNATVAANLDAAVSSRMASFTQPTGFLAATFPSAVSSLTQTQVTGGAYSVQSASCVLGDARIADLDATVSSRASASVAPSWYTAPSGSVDVASINGVATTSVTTVNAVLGTATAGATASALATAQTGITTLLVGVNLNASQHVIVDSGTVTTLTNLPTIPANWITAAGIADGAIDTATFAAGTMIPRVALTDTLTAYTGNTPQTGDSFALIGVAGSGLTALAPAATALSTATWTNELAANLGTLAGHDPGSTLASAAAVAAVPAAVVTYTIGNGRTVGYYLQGGANAISFADDGLTFTVYGTDDTTPLYTGTSMRFATTVGGLRSIDP